MPIPFPELHRRGANRLQKDAARKLGLNFCVLMLNHLHGVQLPWKAVVPPLGTPLNKRQWEAVKRLRPHVDCWNEQPEIDSDAMGRAAVKVESIEMLLADLVRQSGSWTSSASPEDPSMSSTLERLFQQRAEWEVPLSKYRGRQEVLPRSWGHRPAEGEAVGKSTAAPLHPAKTLEPGRLRFWGVPSFDPRPFLDDANAAMFEHPPQHALLPEESLRPIPRVQVRLHPKDKLKFLRTLDACGRLALRPARLVRSGFENGAFAIPKDAQRDRMVLDARPPNCLERSERRWIKSLAGVHQLLHFFLEPEEEVHLFAEDLREFYHAFVISEERTLRNAFKLRVQPHEVENLQCFHKGLYEETELVPCLKTMAMGDTNAVAFGQASHLGVLLQSEVFNLDDFITLHGRPPRQRWLAGLVIDDLVLLEARKRHERPQSSLCAEKIEAVRAQYERVGLPRHAGKAVFDETSGSFWGVQLDGKAGTLRPNMTRAIPLANIILQVLQLGHATVGLLEVIAGSLVAIFRCGGGS
jgi:hypothetical protein